MFFIIFFFNAPPTTAIYTLSLHDALPIYYSTTVILHLLNSYNHRMNHFYHPIEVRYGDLDPHNGLQLDRSEEHTSELQSLAYLVCRLLLEKKKKIQSIDTQRTQIQEPTSS